MPLTNNKVVITLLAYWLTTLLPYWLTTLLVYLYNAFIEYSVLHITFFTFSCSQRKRSNGIKAC